MNGKTIMTRSQQVICRLRDLNKVQQDIIKIVYAHIKNKPASDDWQTFNEVIFYDGRQFRVEMIYRLTDFFIEFKKRDIKEKLT